MARAGVFGLAFLACAVLAANVPENRGVREECVTLCRNAANFINEKGLDAGIAEIANRNGRFVTKNTFVFLMDFGGNLLAHPYAKSTAPNEMNLFDRKDTTGKRFVQEFIKVAQTRGEGWTESMDSKPEEMKKPTPFREKVSSRKLSYVCRVPGKALFVVAGFFE